MEFLGKNVRQLTDWSKINEAAISPSMRKVELVSRTGDRMYAITETSGRILAATDDQTKLPRILDILTKK